MPLLPRLRHFLAATALALSLVPAAASAGPWDGVWELSLHQGKRRVVEHVRLRGASGADASDRLTGRSVTAAGGLQLEVTVQLGDTVGMVAMTVSVNQRPAEVCSGSAYRGELRGVCHDRRGKPRPFSLLPLQLDPEPPGAGPQPAAPLAPLPSAPLPSAPLPSAPPNCQSVLLERGHHPSHLRQCQGVEPICAVAVLRAGHHPAHLVHCLQGLELSCVQTALHKGYHPTHLRHCQDVERDCAVELLERGHHPTHLSSCQATNPTCALAVLRAGHHPTHLQRCR